ncbi:MAG: hypothetical protein WD066_05775 [Planctomycetaceae bacterium]
MTPKRFWWILAGGCAVLIASLIAVVVVPYVQERTAMEEMNFLQRQDAAAHIDSWNDFWASNSLPVLDLEKYPELAERCSSPFKPPAIPQPAYNKYFSHDGMERAIVLVERNGPEWIRRWADGGKHGSAPFGPHLVGHGPYDRVVGISIPEPLHVEWHAMFDPDFDLFRSLMRLRRLEALWVHRDLLSDEELGQLQKRFPNLGIAVLPRPVLDASTIPPDAWKYSNDDDAPIREEPRTE